MKKRLIGLTLLLVLIFSLTACSQGLAAYKETAKQQIETYANAKGEENYSTDGWATIQKIVAEGKLAIDGAKDNNFVDTTICNAKKAIDAVQEEIVGAFYTLQEAFDEDWLTAVDLKNIAFYYRGNSEDGFVASPKNPAELSASTESKIKQLYLSNLQKKVPEATLADIRIAEYYGTYGNCVAVNVWDDCIDYDLSFIPEQLIGGVLFTDYCEREIYIYKTAK